VSTIALNLRRFARLASLGGLLLVLLPSEIASAQQSDIGAYKIADIAQIGVAEAPTIDADLTDPAWAKAGIIEDFRQANPNAGELPTERTIVRVMYDENNLYFGVHAFDSEPELVTIRTQARDGNLGTGDFMRFYLDPGVTRRDGYIFDVGPEGARTEGLLQNNAEVLWEWDAIWQARGTRVADGWIVEVAIPFASLSYDAGRTDWGFDVARSIRRKTERVRWTSYGDTISPNNISLAGTLQGIKGANQGLGLDVQVYGRTTYKENWQNSGDSALSGALGGNLYYKITPALTGTLTVNPDFSDSPLDERQVNTTRFSLFFPETRDFFLQDAATFEFGGRNFQDANNARPFFSRNIGLIDGVPVSILAGGKLSGEFAGFGIGALTAVTSQTSATAAQVLSVARVTRPVLEESQIGAVFTNGDPTGVSETSVIGADFQYRNSNLMGGNILTADFYYERSFSDTDGDDDSFGFAVNFPNEPWRGNISFKQIGENFAPTLGFANRTGIRIYDSFSGYRFRFRNQYLRLIDFNMKHVIVTGLDDNIQSRESRGWIYISNRFADVLAFNVFNYYENVPTSFDLPRNVIVPAGTYNWTNGSIFIDTTQGRRFVLRGEVQCCNFYNGNYLKSDISIQYRPSQYFEIGPRYVSEYIDLPTGYVDIHIFSLSAAANFTPDMQLAIQAQFDTISRNFGLSARYRWEYMPGNELFIGLGQTATVPSTRFRAQTTDLSVRLGQTFRF
jgi:hypothetical protein